MKNKTSDIPIAEIAAHQFIDILLGKPRADRVPPVPAFALCNASPIFESGTKCVVLDESEERLAILKNETDHSSNWPSAIRRCWTQTEQDGRKCQTPR